MLALLQVFAKLRTPPRWLSLGQFVSDDTNPASAF